MRRAFSIKSVADLSAVVASANAQMQSKVESLEARVNERIDDLKAQVIAAQADAEKAQGGRVGNGNSIASRGAGVSGDRVIAWMSALPQKGAA